MNFHNGEISSEKRLWQSVVFQAFVDATSDDPYDKENRIAKRDADTWIRRCGRDFRQVCEMAGLDPDFISESYKRGIDRKHLKKSPDRKSQ